MKFNHVLNNFTSGEWSPKMLARTDTEQYPRAAINILNGMVRPQGGVFRRPGFGLTNRFSFDLSGDIQCIPYTYNGRRYQIFAKASTWYAKDVDDDTEIVLQFSADVVRPTNVNSIRHVQLGDTLFLVHDSGRPLVLQFNTFTSVLLVRNYDVFFSTLFQNAGDTWRSFPFGPVNADGIKGTVTITGTLTQFGTVTINSSLPLFTAAMAQTGAGEPNLLIKITSAGNTAVVQATTFVSDTQMGGIMLSAKTGTSPLTVGSALGTAFELSDWNGRDGFPTTITAIQNRLVFGRKEKIYFTRAGNYYDLMEVPFQQSSTYTAHESDGSRPFSAAPFSTTLVNIVELIAAKTLVILTENSEIVGYGGANGISALPGGFIVESSSSFGAKRVPPVRVNNFVTFVQSIGNVVRDLTFNWESSQYKSQDLSFPAEHLFRKTTVKSMVASELDGSHLWALNTNGELRQCSLDRDYSITAWTPILIQGWTFKAIGVSKAMGAFTDDAFIAVITNGTRHEIVKLAETFDDEVIDPAGEYPEYMDLFTNITLGSPSNTITGLTQYEGMTVQVIGGGYYEGEHVVTGGSVTLNNAYSKFLVGLKSKFRMETMPVEAGAQLGDATGKRKRVHDVFIRFYNTIGAKYGCPQTNTFYDIPFRPSTLPMNEPIPPQTVDVLLSFPASYSRVATVVVESEYPFPCNVLGVGIQGITNE